MSMRMMRATPSHVRDMVTQRMHNLSCQGAGQSGFTLIEVMVSVLVLLVGLMGVMGMQLLSLQTNQSAYFRSQAVYIGSEILDAMRANPTVADNYLGVFPDDGGGASTVPTSPGCADSAGGCTQAEAAQQDLREWAAHFSDVFAVGAANFRATIPEGRAAITATDNEYTVEVSWSERQFDNEDADDGSTTRSVVRDSVVLTTTITP